MGKKIVLECNPDEVLAMVLGLSKKEIQHQPNKGEVCNFQAKQGVKIALVDEDPGSGQPKYLSKFRQVEERHGVIKMTSPDSECVVLVLKPRLEEWIVKQCEISKVNLKDFHLPADAKELKKVINLKLDRFKDLVTRLKEVDNPGINYLRSFFPCA